MAKRWLDILLKITAVAAILFLYLTFRNLRNVNEQYNAVIAVNDSLISERNAVITERNRLDSLLHIQQVFSGVKSDSLAISLRENKALRKSLAAARDSLLNIPDDSIAVVMDAVRPNTEELPAIYSLAGPQARFWYSAYVDYNQTSELLKSAENSLNLSQQYSASLVKENSILLTKEQGYVKDLALCNTQVELFKNNYEKSVASSIRYKKYSYLAVGLGFTLGYLLGGR